MTTEKKIPLDNPMMIKGVMAGKDSYSKAEQRVRIVDDTWRLLMVQLEQEDKVVMAAQGSGRTSFHAGKTPSVPRVYENNILNIKLATAKEWLKSRGKK